MIVAARSKTSALSKTWVMGWNPTEAADVCEGLFRVHIILSAGSDLRTADSPSKESYRLCI
jgi:hypothetical protein